MKTSTPTMPPLRFLGEISRVQEELSPVIGGWFTAAATIGALIILFSTIANALVIYFSRKNPLKRGPLRHLNTVVKHLAIADFLYGLLSSPFTFAYWKSGNR